MGDLQTKFGEGMNILQDSLQQGKQKIQSAQELNQLKKVAQETATKRAQCLIQLGELVYQKYREGEQFSGDITENMESIVTLDKLIYNAQKNIDIQNSKGQSEYKCQCGGVIHANDKFCGSCGTKVEINIEANKGPLINCPKCEEEVPNTSKYCNCCGNRIFQ